MVLNDELCFMIVVLICLGISEVPDEDRLRRWLYSLNTDFDSPKVINRPCSNNMVLGHKRLTMLKL